VLEEPGRKRKEAAGVAAAVVVEAEVVEEEEVDKQANLKGAQNRWLKTSKT
jgi:hypothetical protein